MQWIVIRKASDKYFYKCIGILYSYLKVVKLKKNIEYHFAGKCMPMGAIL